MVFRCCLLTLFTISLAGCQQSMYSRLVGEWVGRPDTAAAAQARSEELKAGHGADAADPIDIPAEDAAARSLGKTDLEQHNVTVHMQLASDKTAHLSLGDGSQPLDGVWRVVTTLPPSGAEIEITLDSPTDEARPKRPEKRRFIVDFQQHADRPGFTLVEKGADPKFGRLYFEPAE